MKSLFFALTGILITLIPSVASPNHANHPHPGSNPNYVIIGAFAVQKNAIRFTNHANRLSEQLKGKASFQLNPSRNLYYVYVLITDDSALAIQEANRLREESQFSDTWVYHGDFNEPAGSHVASKGEDINPVTKGKIEVVNASDNTPSNTQNDSENLMASSRPSFLSPPLKNEAQAPVEDTKTALNGKGFLFKLYRSNDSTEVTGDVDVIDTDRSRKMGSFKGNTPVKVSSPLNKSGDIALICEIFGYRKVQRNINYNTPSAEDVTVNVQNETIVPFELTRLKKGDIAVMYNVYFFKDAGIMRPESRYEVGSLLEMLKENEKYKVKIHGHTNGSAAGKIISMGDDKNFFSLNGTKESLGSAKRLSEERAQVIKEYLVANGIDPSRMQIKAWGGKRPIYDKHSSKAQENVRVEIEILQD